MENESLNKENKQYIVGIGASAGGLEAIDSFFRKVPVDSGLAFVVVQHLSPDYKSLMAELLSKHTDIPVHRIEEGMTVKANNIYLIPPRKNLTIFHGRLLLTEQIREGLNLPIDVFFQSLAEDHNELSIAVVLSGTGSDGTRGIRAIKDRGGMVMVQDEESAKFSGMPNSAIATGLVDFIISAEDMSEQLMAFVKHPYSTHQKISEINENDTDLTRILALIRDKRKLDFTFYKPNTVIRRIERRISINQLNDLSEYAQFIEANPQEISTLYQELLIGVTSFFRDTFVFEEVSKKWLPDITQHIEDNELRGWVSACSTGEEAYSIAMMLAEYREQSGQNFRIKIFATDIDKVAIEKASMGIFPESIVADLPKDYLNKYFIRRDESFQINQKIREMVVFAQHNLIKDPPFTNINLLTCRNVLIYLQPVLQKKILELFNFSLHSEGLLVLGTSESVGDMDEYFNSVSPKAKLYRSRGKYKPVGSISNRDSVVLDNQFQPSITSNYPMHRHRHAEDKILERFVNGLADDVLPFTLIIDDAMEVSHIFGDAKNYMMYPSGKVVTDITKMVINDLSIPVATGIQKALKSNEAVILSNIRVMEQDQAKYLRLHVKNLKGKKGQQKLLAVMISEMETQSVAVESNALSFDLNKEASQRISDLEQELQFTRENLQATVEELETSNEELQATNEELLASNEELQSTNEELQSVNEELYTVNAEYQGKITELTLLNNDLDNLFNSTNIATLFLDENLDVRRFTPRLESIFHIMISDIGRPFFHLSHSIDDMDMLELASQVIENNIPIEKEIQSNEGHWYLFRIMPYAVSDTVYAGVILTFIDINQLKNTQEKLLLSEKEEIDRITTFVEYSNDAITLQDDQGRIITWNQGAEQLYGWNKEEAQTMEFKDIVVKNSLDITNDILKKVRSGHNIQPFESQRVCKDGTIIDVSVSASALHTSNNNRKLVAFTERDMSQQHQLALKDCVLCMQQLAEVVIDNSDAVIILNVSGNITAWNEGAHKLYGWSQEEAINMSFVNLIPQHNRSQASGFVDQLIQGDAVQQSMCVQRVTKDNREINVNIVASVLRNHLGEALLISTSEKAE